MNQWHHRLALRVTKAAVILNNFGASLGHHQTKVEITTVRQSIFNQAVYGWLNDRLLNQSQGFSIDQLPARNGAHATGVGPFIIISNAFIIPGRRENQIFIITYRGKDGHLRTD